MKKQLLAVAIAASLAVPQVGFAAEDASGMQYVSASEGLFGSLRTIYTTGNVKANKGRIQADGSVFGYRGSLDLGNGLTGTYHYEQQILGQQGEKQGDNGDIRYNFVGLKGAFGSMEAGSFGSFVAGVPNVTDVTANGGGAFVPFYRVARGIQYTSPELNGFQAGGHIRMLGGKEKDQNGADGNLVCGTAQADATLTECPDGQLMVSGTPAKKATAGAPQADQWALAGTYKVRGFRVGGAYIVDVDEYITTQNMGATTDNAGDSSRVIKKDDKTQWFLSGKYSQDNWHVAVMHGQTNTSDQSDKTEDETVTSFGGGITVGKVGLAVLHDVASDVGGTANQDRTVTALSAIYNFTARSRVWVAYVANDDDAAANDDSKDRSQDEVIIGMRMDF